MITKRGRRLQRYDLQLIMCGDIVKDSNSYLKSRGSIEDFVSFREMITSQLQGKLWLYDEVRIGYDLAMEVMDSNDSMTVKSVTNGLGGRRPELVTA
ncbi:hypothetical protein Tco_1113160 [Tanacetum coccineum]|uniref:Uncharacterized protein n=1 Tax=Tanacetum coccineum TaxID=301880 RepID=A0ABQ5ITR0_9ASTR